jgi:N-methylhydantoinase A
MPAVSTYVARLEDRLATSGAGGAKLLLMKSNGGVTGAATIRREPVHTALSGPAAGVMGAAFVGGLAGFRNLITVDMGGTSADICLVRDGEPAVTSQGRVGEWPLHVPMIDIHTIGAGGGSIARVEANGALTVGPQSAGAVPGPACYGRGGTEPTVTDANLFLGRLTPTLLAGGMALDPAAAERAVTERVAKPLGLDPQGAARGILSIVDSNMVGAIRVVSVERGHDPRDFVLLPFGGAGPLHATSLARLLGVKTIVVPPAPGVLSAMGLLVSDLRAEFVRTALHRAEEPDLGGMARIFAELEAQAAAWLADEDVPSEGSEMIWQASLRYLHQGFELTVPWAGRSVTRESLAATLARFHALHHQLYTFKQEDTPVEIVTLRVGAIGRLERPEIRELPKGGAGEEALAGRQEVDFEGERLPTPVYDRSRLGAGAVLRGPAILTQLDATTLLFPGQRAEVHKFGALVVEDA